MTALLQAVANGAAPSPQAIAGQLAVIAGVAVVAVFAVRSTRRLTPAVS
jgi:hypothetical protein